MPTNGKVSESPKRSPSDEKIANADLRGQNTELELREGPVRPFVSIDAKKSVLKARTLSSWQEFLLLIVLAVVAICVRCYRLQSPNAAVGAEGRLVTSVNNSIKQRFFLTTGPPMIELLYTTVVTLLSSYDGGYSLAANGRVFTDEFPYVILRTLNAGLGVATVLLFYSTLRLSGVGTFISFLMSIALVVENGITTVSRYILPDSPILFFMALAVYFYKRSELFADSSIKSYKSLILAAVSLGLLVSSSWMGLFTVGWVVILLAVRFVLLIADLSAPVSRSIGNTLTKLGLVVTLVGSIYLSVFYTHIKNMTYDTELSQLMSQEFRSELIGNNVLSDLNGEVGVGSMVTIRHTGTTGGYVHSHNHSYPKGSKQRQITLYPYEDPFNFWVIELYNRTFETPGTFQNITDGTKIRLRHPTGCHLHSHDHKAPVSENADWQKEASCYGYTGFAGDANDDWIVEIDKKASEPGIPQERVIALRTKFRLKHAMTGCYLFSHDTRLPSWGAEQQEVTCATAGIAALTLWYIEENANPLLPEYSEKVSYRPLSFWQKFRELHKVTLKARDEMDLPHPYHSMAITFPFLLNGVDMDHAEGRDVYFLGNAITWWSLTVFLVCFIVSVVFKLLRWQVGKLAPLDTTTIAYYYNLLEFLLGFAVNFLPLVNMGDQLFIFSYLPAYYFGLLSLGLFLNSLVTGSCKRMKYVGYLLILFLLAGATYFFVDHRALIYGTEWDFENCMNSKWLGSWDYNCGNYGTSEDFSPGIVHSDITIPDEFTYDFIPSTSQSLMEEVGPTPAAVNQANLESFDKLMEAPGEVVFKDEHGNVIPPEEAKRRLAHGGGYVVKKDGSAPADRKADEDVQNVQEAPQAAEPILEEPVHNTNE